MAWLLEGVAEIAPGDELDGVWDDGSWGSEVLEGEECAGFSGVEDGGEEWFASVARCCGAVVVDDGDGDEPVVFPEGFFQGVERCLIGGVVEVEEDVAVLQLDGIGNLNGVWVVDGLEADLIGGDALEEEGALGDDCGGEAVGAVGVVEEVVNGKRGEGLNSRRSRRTSRGRIPLRGFDLAVGGEVEGAEFGFALGAALGLGGVFVAHFAGDDHAVAFLEFEGGGGEVAVADDTEVVGAFLELAVGVMPFVVDGEGELCAVFGVEGLEGADVGGEVSGEIGVVEIAHGSGGGNDK